MSSQYNYEKFPEKQELNPHSKVKLTDLLNKIKEEKKLRETEI